MKYSIITQRCGCHLIVEALLRSVHKYLSPDEIIVSSWNKSLGELMHREVLKTRNDFFLMLDQDILIFDNNIVEEMYKQASEPNTLACGAIDLGWEQDGFPRILVASCNMVNKSLYLENNVPFWTSEPCMEAFGNAMRIGQRLARVGSSIGTVSTAPEVFHLNQGFKSLYPDMTVGGWWHKIFNEWKVVSGSKENLDDYIVDDGMDYDDQMRLNDLIVQTIRYWAEIKINFSLLQLGREGVELLTDYYKGKAVDTQIAEELIGLVKEATWVDHAHLFLGCSSPLYDAQLDNDCSDLYKKVGTELMWASHYHGRFCSPIQNYMLFVTDSKDTFYTLVPGKKILYAGPHDFMGDLNNRKPLGASQLGFCQLSGGKDSIGQFFANVKVKDWDIIFVSAGLYANIIVGRIKQEGGVGVNIGDAITFNLDERLKQVLELNEDGISYRVKDHYPNYGKRLYEKYYIEV